MTLYGWTITLTRRSEENTSPGLIAFIEKKEGEFMSILSVLKTIGHDAQKLGSWIDDGLKIAGNIAEETNPSLVPIITAVELAIESLESTASHPLNAATVQSVVTAVTTLEGIKPGLTALLGNKISVPSMSRTIGL